MAEEPTQLIHVCGILGIGPHQETHDLGLIVGLMDGTRAVLRFQLGLLSGLSLVLRDYLAKASYSDDGGMVAAQPMQMNSCQPFAMQDGRVGMVLEVEHMKLPVTFPVEGLPILLKSIERMIELSRKPPAPKVN